MPSNSSFVHLHTHSEFSVLDGLSTVDALADAAAKDGQPALGITDHGYLSAVPQFVKECGLRGVKPILGLEAYMARERIDERPEASDERRRYYHLTLLARDAEGWRNLLALSAKSWSDGYWYKPRIDYDMLSKHAAGITATTGCLSSVVSDALTRGRNAEALELAGKLQSIFGKEHFFVELQDHNIAAQRKITPGLIEISEKMKAPFLATNDIHYTNQCDHVAHDALLCVQTSKLISDTDRMRFGDNPAEQGHHYLKSAEEMRLLFPHDEYPNACDNTLLVAESCDLKLTFGDEMNLPRIEVPDTYASDDEWLRDKTMQGAAKRWGEISSAIQERLDFELGVIAAAGFASYLLIVTDITDEAARRSIRIGPGRGSVSGSAVAYALGITEIDPLEHDLLFERFLNPQRASMPDIDLDIEDRRRGEMISYVVDKYGAENVGRVVAHSRIKARQALKDAARVLGQPPSVGDKVASLIPPPIAGRTVSIGESLANNESELARTLASNEPGVAEIINVASGIEGVLRQNSMHAAAVVIAPSRLDEMVPMMSLATAKGIPITQWDGGEIEACGLLKMDFLGLRALSVIDDTLKLIKQSGGEVPDLYAIADDDPGVLQLFSDGDLLGVFQMESSPMRLLSRSLQPTGYTDVCALIALYRPGPMASGMDSAFAERKNGRQPVTFLHPDLEEVLSDTQGLMIYQETMMRVAEKMAGYSLAQADELRKACGKKDRDLLAKHRVSFVDGCESQGHSRKIGEQLFAEIEPFADYAFNKSHAYGYGLLAWQTAYLKTYWRAEFMAATLTSWRNTTSKSGSYIYDARKAGLHLAPPHINKALDGWSVNEVAQSGAGAWIGAGGVADGETRELLAGFACVKNVSDQTANEIISERESEGDFVSLKSFATRMRGRDAPLNSRALKSLVSVGAFDDFGERNMLLNSVEDVLSSARKSDANQTSMFGEEEGTQDIVCEPADGKTIRAWEKEGVGAYLSSHPLDDKAAVLQAEYDATAQQLRGLADRLETAANEAHVEDEGEDDRWSADAVGNEAEGGYPTPRPKKQDDEWRRVRVVGTPHSRIVKNTKHGDPMCAFTLEDLTGTCEVVCFPTVWRAAKVLLGGDQMPEIIVVEGTVDSAAFEENRTASDNETITIRAAFISEPRQR